MKSTKRLVAKLLVFTLLLTSVLVNNTVSLAAKKPTISKEEVTVLEGKKFNLNVDNKVKGSTYQWKTSNKKVATVDERGYVTGVKKGKVTVTVTVKVSEKKTYTLESKVTVRKPATKIEINNKVSALNVGQKYNLNRTLTPSTSNDLTTLTSSSKLIANPAANGKFTALREGTVTITAKTLSGAKDTVKIRVVDKDGTVTTQEELDALLGSGVQTITIKTDKAITFKIPAGDYSKTTLVIDAAKATIDNKGTFKEVKRISSDTVDLSGGSTGGGGTGGGSTPTPTPTPIVKEVTGVEKDGVTKFELPKALGETEKVVVSYKGATFDVSEEIIDKVAGFLKNDEATVKTWKDTTSLTSTKTVNGYTVTVTGTAGDLTKTVKYAGGSYVVTVDDVKDTVTIKTASNTYVLSQSGNSLSIDNAPSGLKFIVTYK